LVPVHYFDNDVISSVRKRYYALGLGLGLGLELELRLELELELGLGLGLRQRKHLYVFGQTYFRESVVDPLHSCNNGQIWAV